MKKSELLARIEALEAEVQRLKAHQAAPPPSVSPLQPYAPIVQPFPFGPMPAYPFGPGRMAPYPARPLEVTCLGAH